MVGKHVRDVQREDSGMLRDVAGMAKLWVLSWWCYKLGCFHGLFWCVC